MGRQLQSSSRRNSSIFERPNRTEEDDDYDGYEDDDADQVSLSLNELINQDEDILIHSLKHQQQRKLYHQNNTNNNNVIPTFIDKLSIWKNKLLASATGNTTNSKTHNANKAYENPFFLANEEEDEFYEVPLTHILNYYHYIIIIIKTKVKDKAMDYFLVKKVLIQLLLFNL